MTFQKYFLSFFKSGNIGHGTDKAMTTHTQKLVTQVESQVNTGESV